MTIDRNDDDGKKLDLKTVNKIEQKNKNYEEPLISSTKQTEDDEISNENLLIGKEEST